MEELMDTIQVNPQVPTHELWDFLQAKLDLFSWIYGDITLIKASDLKDRKEAATCIGIVTFHELPYLKLLSSSR